MSEAPDQPRPTWAYTPGEDPAWDDPAIPRKRVGADEIPALADAVVRGASLTFCIIEDLRALIDAVQYHPRAHLARAEEDKDGFLRPTGVFNAAGNRVGGEPTQLTLRGCVIEKCDCSDLDIGCSLTVASRFVNDARFDWTRFAARAWFGDARFTVDAQFGRARFAADAWFAGARFAADVDFTNAHFAVDVMFNNTRFASNARFDYVRFGIDAYFVGIRFDSEVVFNHARFAGITSFRKAHFATDATFDYARFADSVWFSEARFNAKAKFVDARFADSVWFVGARFDDSALFVCARFNGGAVFCSAHFDAEASFHDVCFNDIVGFVGACFAGPVMFRNAEINRRLELSSAEFGPDARLDIAGIVVRAGASLLLDTAQLNMTTGDSGKKQKRRKASADAVPLGLGLKFGPRGRLIKGEDSNDREQLAEAAESYNLLRDIFRAQPSTDAHEEICAIRHHDLTRRAKPRPHWWSHIPGFFHWLVMRNALGYLMNPWRPIITGGILLVLFALVYGLCIGPGDIGHGAFAPVADDAGGYVYPDAYDYWNHDPLNPLYLSLMTFVTLGYGDFQPASGWLKLVTGVEGILGVTLLALFTVAWGRKMVR